MTVLEIAQSIGYSSLSQFNVVLKNTIIVHQDNIEISPIPPVLD